MMADRRANNVQRYREEENAHRVYILSAIQPFSVSQDRFIVIEHWRGARLVLCTGCTPRTPFGQGVTQDISPDTLAVFDERIAAAQAAWESDALPDGVHDGVTLTIEYADLHGYRRVRMVDPPEGSVHEQLLAAWMTTFPEVAHALT